MWSFNLIGSQMTMKHICLAGLDISQCYLHAMNNILFIFLFLTAVTMFFTLQELNTSDLLHHYTNIISDPIINCKGRALSLTHNVKIRNVWVSNFFRLSWETKVIDLSSYINFSFLTLRIFYHYFCFAHWGHIRRDWYCICPNGRQIPPFY